MLRDVLVLIELLVDDVEIEVDDDVLLVLMELLVLEVEVDCEVELVLRLVLVD